jgi:hypothetical protein
LRIPTLLNLTLYKGEEMKICMGCEGPIEAEMSPNSDFCFSCNGGRMRLEAEAQDKMGEITFQFKGWKVEASAAISLFEERANWVYLDAIIGGGKTQLLMEIALKKREGFEDQFLVAIGDKQIIVRAQPPNDDARYAQGIVLSQHEPLERVDGPEPSED